MLLILLALAARKRPNLTEVPTNPDYPRQFSLKNTGQSGGLAGEDLNIEKVWDSFTGVESSINVICGGCIQHSSLRYKYGTGWSYLTNSTGPEIQLSDPRGTSVAGIIAASSGERCSVGISYNAQISCTNLYNAKYTQANFYDSVQREPNVFEVKMFANPFAIPGNGTYQGRDLKLEQIMSSLPDSLSFVASAGQDGVSSGDSNMLNLLRNPRVVVVGDLTNRGTKSAWSNEGANILVSAVVGGDASEAGVLQPSIPGLGCSTDKDCGTDVDPRGIGAAIVTGVIGQVVTMAKQYDVTITWRDVQAMLILAAVKNDPSHHSWIQRPEAVYGGRYSPVYGFGRVDMDLMGEIIPRYGEPLPQQTQVHMKNEQTFNVPCLRSGSVKIVLVNATNTIKFVEYVIVRMSVETDDFAWLRISLTSPSQTRIPLKRYVAAPRGKKTTSLEFLVRGFFSEPGTGTWTLSVGSDSASSTTSVNSVTLEVYGTDSIPSMFILNERVGGQSYSPTSYSASFAMGAPAEVQCGQAFNVSVSGLTVASAKLYVGDSTRMSRWFHGQLVPGTNSVTIPCLFNDTKPLLLIGEAQPLSGATAPVAVKNNCTEEVLASPKPYEKYTLKGEPVNIIVQPVMCESTWPNGVEKLQAVVSLLDTQTSKVVFQKQVDLRAPITISYNGTDCQKCLVTLTTKWWNYNKEECRQLIQPISIAAKPLSAAWPVKLSSKCPIPRGVMTPTPAPTPSPSPTGAGQGGHERQTAAALALGVLFFACFALSTVIFFFCNRVKGPTIEGSLNCYHQTGNYPVDV